MNITKCNHSRRFWKQILQGFRGRIYNSQVWVLRKIFLLNKAYHTKYCDKPAPDNPNYTCAQLGYHYKGVKETVADNPKAQSLNRCYKRIDKDLSRRIITAEEREILYAKAKDLYHHAKSRREFQMKNLKNLLLLEIFIISAM